MAQAIFSELAPRYLTPEELRVRPLLPLPRSDMLDRGDYPLPPLLKAYLRIGRGFAASRFWTRISRWPMYSFYCPPATGAALCPPFSGAGGVSDGGAWSQTGRRLRRVPLVALHVLAGDRGGALLRPGRNGMVSDRPW